MTAKIPRPAVKRITEFRYDVEVIQDHPRHLQTYLAQFEDPNLPESRMNALDLDAHHIESYWRMVDKFVVETERKSKDSLTDREKMRLERYKTALRFRDTLESSGRAIFGGFEGEQYNAILASINAKLSANDQKRRNQDKKKRRSNPNSPDHSSERPSTSTASVKPPKSSTKSGRPSSQKPSTSSKSSQKEKLIQKEKSSQKDKKDKSSKPSTSRVKIEPESRSVTPDEWRM